MLKGLQEGLVSMMDVVSKNADRTDELFNKMNLMIDLAHKSLDMTRPKKHFRDSSTQTPQQYVECSTQTPRSTQTPPETIPSQTPQKNVECSTQTPPVPKPRRKPKPTSKANSSVNSGNMPTAADHKSSVVSIQPRVTHITEDSENLVANATTSTIGDSTMISGNSVQSISATVPNDNSGRQKGSLHKQVQHKKNYQHHGHNQKLMLIHSSRGNRLRAENLLHGDPVAKRACSTISNAASAVNRERDTDFTDVTVFTGSNDIQNYWSQGRDVSEVGESLCQLLDLAALKFASARIHVCTIFTRHDVPDDIIIHVNSIVTKHAEMKGYNIIDLAVRIRDEDLHDGLHTNNIGTSKVAKAITANIKQAPMAVSSDTSPKRPYPYHQLNQSTTTPNHYFEQKEHSSLSPNQHSSNLYYNQHSWDSRPQHYLQQQNQFNLDSKQWPTLSTIHNSPLQTPQPQWQDLFLQNKFAPLTYM